MKTACFHLRPRARSLSARVLRRGRDPKGYFVVLEDTVLYPEGGGQPRDYGTVDGVEVRDLQAGNEGFLHYLDTPIDGEFVEVTLAWPRRWDHMQQHTGQHLLTAVAQKGWGLATTSFHLGSSVSDIELDRPGLSNDLLREIESAVASEIEAARPVTTSWLEADAIPDSVRTRGLPSNHQGPVRLVEIEDLDCTTCGGTHVGSTSEIGGLALLGAEAMRGGSRLHFVAGDRWRRRLARDESLLGGLRQQLGCKEEEMQSLLERRLQEISALQRSLHLETGKLASFYAERLATGSTALAEAHFEDRDGAFLRMVAAHLQPLADGRLFLLTAQQDEQLHFLLAGTPEDDRVAELGCLVCGALGGRGGGRGGTFQGKAAVSSHRNQAFELLASTVSKTQSPEKTS